MDYSDNSPERRNLTLTSVAFILFYIGDGELKGHSLALPMINVEFNNLIALKAAALLALLWFAYQYMLVMPELYYKFRGREITNIKLPPIINRQLEKHLDLNIRRNFENIHSWTLIQCHFTKRSADIHNRDDRWRLQAATEVYTGAEGESKNHYREELDLTGMVRVYFLWVATYTAATKPTVANYIFPLILFNLAITGPLWQPLFDN
jgi:hypothetical protein